MTLTRNPFDAGGYSLADMTQAINILPNLYTRLGQIGLFRFEGVSQRSIVIEQREGVLSLRPQCHWVRPPPWAPVSSVPCHPLRCRGSRMMT